MQNQTMNVNVATKPCPYCGEMVPLNSQKCKHCGEWLIKRYGNSWVKTYLLCSLLGCFGAHNFYNEKTGIAVAQLILTLTVFGLFISIPWVIVDAIIILCGAYRDNKGLELSRKPTIQSTALLCFFCGAGGVHRFYTKQVALGWLQAFSSCIGIWFIWAFIDFIMILTGNFKDADGNLIKG